MASPDSLIWRVQARGRRHVRGADAQRAARQRAAARPALLALALAHPRRREPCPAPHTGHAACLICRDINMHTLWLRHSHYQNLGELLAYSAQPLAFKTFQMQSSGL